ncbi:uncharacterized protein ASPGLDRAFT_53337 [Aspergillus glaucus CBS 516.65]|uniref:Uncharacterized protein n=1 Tax=Aspergillus glaucus CBS 516.65 TaxID=1160497 RepID=A0A1L9V4B4_ASPGL|nr:hypothetical protein ASPGLDRAFT_53337 [Aspergillus glaucus CBS 516.65]OJJ78741.1 hypothetical protein ASPGLDRAFT_53337 [Aspergillus glaucus CBS 516.65]
MSHSKKNNNNNNNKIKYHVKICSALWDVINAVPYTDSGGRGYIVNHDSMPESSIPLTESSNLHTPTYHQTNPKTKLGSLELHQSIP